jgi:hypothetical protein
MHSVSLPIRLIRILLIPLMLFAGAIGVSYSLYTDRIDIDAKASMGRLDVVFSDLYISESSPASYGSIDPKITEGEKSIEINITDAVPGCYACICFEVKNNGTVPVFYELADSGGGGILSVSADSGCLYAGGGTANGQINILVSGSDEQNEIRGLNFVLNFRQADVEK